MKKIVFILIICFTILKANALSFTIQGEIEGLKPGDILTFEQISLPEYNSVLAFEVIVTEHNTFTHKGEHDNIRLYLMSYKPIGGKEPVVDRIGVEILIKEGVTLLTGTANQIYYVHLEGGLYNNDLLQKIIQLDNSLGVKRGELFRLSNEAHIAEDFKKKQEYSDQISSFSSKYESDFEKLSKLYSEFYEKHPSSEHIVIKVLSSVNYAPYESSFSRYEKMNSEAQNSYFGKILKQKLDKNAALQPGKDAPNFHLTSLDGREISLTDCTGSYVLIYHWGLCPGSFQRENDLTTLYNKYKDKLIVIGVTDNIDLIKEQYDNSNSGEKIVGLDMKSVLESMLVHPWFDSDKTGSNEKFATDYALVSLPYFVLISPDGKIIARDSHKAYFEAKAIIESEFGEL